MAAQSDTHSIVVASVASSLVFLLHFVSCVVVASLTSHENAVVVVNIAQDSHITGWRLRLDCAVALTSVIRLCDSAAAATIVRRAEILQALGPGERCRDALQLLARWRPSSPAVVSCSLPTHLRVLPVSRRRRPPLPTYTPYSTTRVSHTTSRGDRDSGRRSPCRCSAARALPQQLWKLRLNDMFVFAR